MTKKEWIFAITLISISTLVLFSSGSFILNTSISMLALSFVLLLFSNTLEIPIGGMNFTSKPFVVIFLLLFLSPETILLLSAITTLINSRNLKRFIIRFSFEIAQISLGRLFFKLAPNDFSKIIFFSIGYFTVNVLLTFIYIKLLTKTDLKRYILAALFVFLLGIFGSIIVGLPYIFPEVTLFNLLIFIIIYTGFFIHLYTTANAIVWRQELDLEKEQLSREISNLMKLPEVLDEQVDNLDELIEKVLNISCELIGFEYALLSIFDFNTGRVIRLSKSGISEEDFKNLREKNVSIRETYALFQQRFDVGGAYFIPKGSINLDSDSIYYPSKYASLDTFNAWDPDDLFLVPLFYSGKIIGYLSYDKPKNLLRPTIREVQFARFFAWHLTKILSQSNYSMFFSHQTKQQQSYSSVMSEISKAIESRRNFILVYLDVDHFEKINMTLGFEKGDEILKNLSDITADELKNLGIFSTVGDEEIILMWSKSKSDGVLLAERIREEIKTKYPMVEISACVVKYPSDAENFDELIEKARIGLVTVKKSGGGRVISL